MNKFEIKKTKFRGVLIIIPRIFDDDRGYFYESYNVANLFDLGFTENMQQDNQSISKKNVIRGLHYQWDEPMGKLVRATRGSVKDIIVDIRKDSVTYGEYMSVTLTDKNHKQLWVPPGFAHGILALEEDTVVLYKCSSVYNQNGESGINPFDKFLNIKWGIDKKDAVLSLKDQEAQNFLEYDRDPKFY